MGLLFGSVSADLLAVLVVLVGYVYWHYSRAFKFWEDKGLPFSKPSFPAGNFGSILQEPLGFLIKRLYDELKHKGKFGGYYAFTAPTLIVNDPEMIKIVTVRDFNYFHDRGLYYNENADPLSAHLFSIEGVKWKNLRVKLSPTFTSGKLKMMFPLMLESSAELLEYFRHQTENNPDIEIREPLARFTTDIIGNCAFGIKCNTLKDPDATIRKYGKMHFNPTALVTLQRVFALFFTKSAKKLGVRFIDKHVSDFFIGVVKETVEYREKIDNSRNDFMQLMVQLKNQPTNSLTLNEVAAQAFVFFLGGFETSSTTMTFTMFELSKHPEIQEKVREEIEEVLAKYGGEITYEGLNEMAYLEMVVYETLRKHPIFPILVRVVSTDYTLPNSRIVIPAGTDVVIPVLGLHRDPEYYPEPDRFDPDRFTEENKAKRQPYTFLPFGEGPRKCIGIRFGMLQAKLGIASILRHYKIESCDRTPDTIKYSTKGFKLTPAEEFCFKFILLKK